MGPDSSLREGITVAVLDEDDEEDDAADFISEAGSTEVGTSTVAMFIILSCGLKLWFNLPEPVRSLPLERSRSLPRFSRSHSLSSLPLAYAAPSSTPSGDKLPNDELYWLKDLSLSVDTVLVFERPRV